MLYLFSVTALGILLATFTTSMAQFGLLVIPVLVILQMLSGSSTPIETMPTWLQNVMQLAPTTHFVSFSQAVLYRGAGIEIVWPQLLAIAVISGVIFAISGLTAMACWYAASRDSSRPRRWATSIKSAGTTGAADFRHAWTGKVADRLKLTAPFTRRPRRSRR